MNRFIKKIMLDEEKIRLVNSIYRELDREIRSFRKRTGLSCYEGCGHCCEREDIEATVLEFLPLAMELWKKKHAEYWLDRITRSGKGTCVFYKPSTDDTGKGCCSIYRWRGLICRLFAFSALRQKDGHVRFAPCSVMKRNDPERVRNIQGLMDLGLSAPVMTSFSNRMFNIDPVLGKRFMPINQAIKAAIEKVGFILDIKKGRYFRAD